jgi:hypothetical protein
MPDIYFREAASQLFEKWSDAARAAASAGRKGRGKGLVSRKLAARKAFKQAGGKRKLSGPISVETRSYVSSHGRKPTGHGSWAFHPNRNISGGDKSIVWKTGSYKVAKRKAVRAARQRHWPSVNVLS